MYAWAVRRATFLHDRIVKHGEKRGVTTFHLTNGASYVAQLTTFGSLVLVKLHGIGEAKRIAPKRKSRRGLGVWLGKIRSSDERILSTPDGIHLARATRCRPTKFS